jgi:hypothetical protein
MASLGKGLVAVAQVVDWAELEAAVGTDPEQVYRNWKESHPGMEKCMRDLNLDY